MLIYGHRGARGEAPENTLPGFAHALRLGVRALELDVRLSADKQLVVIHDATVDRTTNAAGDVASYTAAQLAGLDATKSCPGWPEPAGVPTLSAVLEAFPDVSRWAVEIKRDAPDRMEQVAARMQALIERHGIAARTIVTSFDSVALDLARRLLPDVPRAYIGAFDTPAYLETALDFGCRQVDVPLHTGSLAVVREAQARGMVVTGWLGNSPEAMRTLVAWGVDQITTDYPTMALAWLRACAAGETGAVPPIVRRPGRGGFETRPYDW